MKKPAFSSRWSKYKRWCLEVLHHPFGASFRSQINYETVLAQVMEYLSYFKASCTSFSSFSDTKTMLAWVYKSVFAYQFGTDVRIMQWMKGWQHEKPKSVKFDTDTDGWDVGLIVDYWSRQPPNAELTTVELGYKALSLFAVAVYPRPSDLARLSRDSLSGSLMGFAIATSAPRSFVQFQSLQDNTASASKPSSWYAQLWHSRPTSTARRIRRYTFMPIPPTRSSMSSCRRHLLGMAPTGACIILWVHRHTLGG